MTTGLLEHLDEDRCAELVLGLLPDAERDAAVTHAERCEECARRLHAHVSTQARMFADLPRATPARATIRRIPRAAYWLPAAAALVVVSLWLARNAALPPRATESHWLPSLGAPQLLRGEEALDPHLSAGMEAYAQRDLRTAVRELASARSEGPAEQARLVYLAHAWLELGEPARAVPLLRAVDFSQLPAGLSREAAGMLVRALRASGDTFAADTLELMLRRTPEWVPVRP